MGNFRSAEAGALDRSRIAEQIFRELKDGIVLGTIPQGTKLPSERELALRYGVSGPTVREAIRGLTLLGLADVRHGSGAFVTANTESLVATSLSTVIQLGKAGVADVLGVLGVLNEHAAGLAAVAATGEDHARLHAALDALSRATTAEMAADAVRSFHSSIAIAAHNPLLAALCGFLSDVQIELGDELVGKSIEHWQRLISKLKPVRTALVEAIVSRDREAAVESAREFQAKALHFITSLPKAKEVRLTDPKLRQLLSSMMTRVGSS
jgi:GntR family transcriptional regulator, transcriptional repressor for pyruvate dehydrogenase complex